MLGHFSIKYLEHTQIKNTNQTLANLIYSWRSLANLTTQYPALQEYLLEQMSKQKIGEKGYAWILTHQGIYILSENRQRDGENVYNFQDQPGHYPTREIIKTAIASKPGDIVSLEYYWKNPSHPDTLRKISYFTYHSQLKWIIGVGSYYDDMFKEIIVFKKYAIIVLISCTLLGTLLAYFLATNLIHPIHQLTEAIEDVKKGNWGRTVPVRGKDEIATLTQLFNEMNLKIDTQRIILTNRNKQLAYLFGLTHQKEELRRKNGSIEEMLQYMQKFAGKGLTQQAPLCSYAVVKNIEYRLSGHFEGPQCLIKKFSVDSKHDSYVAINYKSPEKWKQENIRFIQSMFSICASFIKEKELVEKNQRIQTNLIENSKLATLGEMASGIAHEINNPLSIIAGYSKILEQNIESPNPDKDLNLKLLFEIQSTVNRIAQIIRGLRHFARDASTDKMQVYELKSIIINTLEFCSEKFKRQDINIILELQDDLLIKCRETQISQVILNMLNNSFDAIQNIATKWIRLTTTSSNKTVTLHICDSGSGILPQYRNKILNPFFTTKETGAGTGLGLSVSHGIIQDHGGTIEYNDKSEHTCFTISLPLHQATA